MPLTLQDIVEVLEGAAEGIEFYLNLGTGEFRMAALQEIAREWGEENEISFS